jgi:hypothetical protein
MLADLAPLPQVWSFLTSATSPSQLNLLFSLPTNDSGAPFSVGDTEHPVSAFFKVAQQLAYLFCVLELSVFSALFSVS